MSQRFSFVVSLRCLLIKAFRGARFSACLIVTRVCLSDSIIPNLTTVCWLKCHQYRVVDLRSPFQPSWLLNSSIALVIFCKFSSAIQNKQSTMLVFSLCGSNFTRLKRNSQSYCLIGARLRIKIWRQYGGGFYFIFWGKLLLLKDLT